MRPERASKASTTGSLFDVARLQVVTHVMWPLTGRSDRRIQVILRDYAKALHAHERICPQRRRHACADELYGAHQRRVRQRRAVHLKRQSRDSAEYFVVVADLVDDLVRPA